MAAVVRKRVALGHDWALTHNRHYAVSRFGGVMRVTSSAGTWAGKVLRPGIGGDGYPLVVLYDGKGGKKSTHVHGLVATAFLGKRRHGYWVNHIDGNKQNNRADNLEYLTPSGNMWHASRTGLLSLGEQRKGTKLRASQVRAIRKRKAAGFSLSEIGKQFGVHGVTVHDIISGRTWSHLI